MGCRWVVRPVRPPKLEERHCCHRFREVWCGMWTMSGKRQGARHERRSEKGTSKFFLCESGFIWSFVLLLRVESRTLSLILFWIDPKIGVDTLEPEAALSKIAIYETYQDQDHQSANNLHVGSHPHGHTDTTGGPARYLDLAVLEQPSVHSSF